MSFLAKQQKSEHTDSHDKSGGNAFLGGNYALFSGYKFCLLCSCNVVWVIGSGATNHIYHDLSLFSYYAPMQDIDNGIRVPDGRKVEIKHVGTVILGGNVVLKNVFHVPGF